MSEKTSRQGKTITLYVPFKEWESWREKLKGQGLEGTDEQVTEAVRKHGLIGIRTPIKSELEQSMFGAPQKG